MKLPNPFARLLGLQRTADARERLHALRGKYALTENDPIWELVSVLEDFCADLRAESHSSAPSESAPNVQPSTSTSESTLHPWRIVALCSAGAALQTLLLALSFVAGAHTTHMAAALPSALAVPVGWVMLVLFVPLLGGLTIFGWRARRREPAIGWTLAICSAASIAAYCTALWRLL